MVGVITGWDILVHPITTIRCFGWRVFFMAVAPWQGKTFLSLLRPAALPRQPIPYCSRSAEGRCDSFGSRKWTSCRRSCFGSKTGWHCLRHHPDGHSNAGHGWTRSNSATAKSRIYQPDHCVDRQYNARKPPEMSGFRLRRLHDEAI